MKKLLALLAVAALSFSATSLRADLLGTKVNGTLTFNGGTTNYFDPANGFVPAGDGNASSANNVVIGPGVEFGFKDGSNRDVANFTGTGLTVRDVCLDGSTCTFNGPFKMTFTDTAFTSASLLSNDLNITFSFSGNTLTVNYPGSFVADGNATAVFAIGFERGNPRARHDGSCGNRHPGRCRRPAAPLHRITCFALPEGPRTSVLALRPATHTPQAPSYPCDTMRRRAAQPPRHPASRDGRNRPTATSHHPCSRLRHPASRTMCRSVADS